jgi:hypothetical protein
VTNKGLILSRNSRTPKPTAILLRSLWRLLHILLTSFNLSPVNSRSKKISTMGLIHHFSKITYWRHTFTTMAIHYASSMTLLRFPKSDAFSENSPAIDGDSQRTYRSIIRGILCGRGRWVVVAPSDAVDLLLLLAVILLLTHSYYVFFSNGILIQGGRTVNKRHSSRAASSWVPTPAARGLSG